MIRGDHPLSQSSRPLDVWSMARFLPFVQPFEAAQKCDHRQRFK